MEKAADGQRVRPPQQARSRATYERILDALEAALETKPFEEITVRELLERSGASTGSFYARFPTKDTLLPALYDRYDAELHRATLHRTPDPRDATAPDEAGRDRPEAAETTLEETVRGIFRRIVDRLHERRWLMRAVALHARQHPDLIPDEQRRRRHLLHERWRARLLAHRDRMSHPDPERAVAFGLFMTVTACREKIVFPDAPHASSFQLSRDDLVDEASRALLTYLGAASPDEGAESKGTTSSGTENEGTRGEPR